MTKSIFSIGVVVAAFILAGIRPDAKADVDASSAKPMIDSPEGQRAFDDLAKGYVNSSGLFDAKAALANLKSPDATTARRSGNYLMALFAQSFADESNGRALWHPTPFTNEGPGNGVRSAVTFHLHSTRPNSGHKKTPGNGFYRAMVILISNSWVSPAQICSMMLL
jgi:hypothetical protein